MSTFVIGVGRRSAGNDGVGPRVIDWLRKRTLPQGTALHVVREPSELLAFEAAQRLIVVDAVVGAPAPGQVVVLAAEALESMRAPAQGSHGISLSDALALGRRLQGAAFPNTSVVGIGIGAPPKTPSVELDEDVAAAIETAGRAVLRLLSYT